MSQRVLEVMCVDYRQRTNNCTKKKMIKKKNQVTTTKWVDQPKNAALEF